MISSDPGTTADSTHDARSLRRLPQPGRSPGVNQRALITLTEGEIAELLAGSAR